MKRLVALFSLCAVFLCLAWPELSAAQPVVVRPAPPARAPVVVLPGWPIKRAPRLVVVRPPRAVVPPPVVVPPPPRAVVVPPPRVAVRVPPVRYAPVVIFRPVVVPVRRAPGKHALVWEDSETLLRHEEWVEFTLNCNSRGRRLWFDVGEGRARIDWAEVVFDNGEVQVVDFKGDAVEPGLYSLLDFADGRHVNHVRMVARASSARARITLRMEK